MTMKIELQEELKRIEAKVILQMPLTSREYALWVLYGNGIDVRKPV